MNKAIFVCEVIVTDPDTKAPVTLSVFKDKISEGMFAIDSSYLEQTFDDEETITVPNVFLSDSETLFDKRSCFKLCWS